MTTKELFTKQIIILMSSNNINIIVLHANVHIANINRLFKNIKYNVSANFIFSDNKGVIITTKKMAAALDMKIINKYIKELDNINSNIVMCP